VQGALTHCGACGKLRLLKGCGCEACQPRVPFTLPGGEVILLCDDCWGLPSSGVIAAKVFALRVLRG